MGRPCLTCQLPPAVRKKVDKLLVENRPLAQIKEMVPEVSSVDSLRRHKERCLHKNLLKAQDARVEDYARDLWEVFSKSVDRLGKNVEDLEDIIKTTKKRKHYNVLIKALAEVRSTLELAYKMAASMCAMQRAEEEIEKGELAKMISIPHSDLKEIFQELTKSELELLAKVSQKIAEKTGQVSNRPILPVEPVEALPEEVEEGEAKENNSGGMVRTTRPGESGSKIGHDSTPVEDTPPSTITEIQGPVDPRKQRPHVPSSLIHFESGQAFTGHLWAGRRSRKRRKR